MDKRNKERFIFAVFLAAALHSALIFGIGFNWEPEPNAARSLEVTVTLTPSESEPTDADFIASANSIGSGTLDEAKQITTNTASNLSGQSLDQAAQNQVQLDQGKRKNTALVSTTNHTSMNTQTDATEVDKHGNDSIDQQAISASEIAALRAKLDMQRQQYAARPRIKRLTAVAAKAAEEAAYLTRWQQHVERVGNLNYPAQARKQKVYGELRMLVSILPDGRLHDARIIHSSGSRLLDNAALKIVSIASPFPELPTDITSTYDRLEVIRTWKFERGNVLRDH